MPNACAAPCEVGGLPLAWLKAKALAVKVQGEEGNGAPARTTVTDRGLTSGPGKESL